MNNYAVTIQVLTVVVVVGSLFLAFRAVLSPSAGEGLGVGVGAGGEEQMARLEDSLKKVLEKASIVGSAGAGGDSAPLLAEIESLKKELQTKQSEIERVKIESEMQVAAGRQAPAGGISLEEKNNLQNQINELTAKLAEYEIISEDIADLSMYKEQSAKLQEEVDRLKKEKELAASSAPPVATTPPASTPPPQPEIIAKPPAPPPAVAQPVADSAPAAEEGGIFDDDLMAEFAAAVAEQKSTTASSEPAAAVATKEPEAAPIEEPEASAGDLDLSRMVAEASSLENVEIASDVDPLAQDMDPEKLAAEASSMGAVESEDLKLMSDFEKFADEKKG